MVGLLVVVGVVLSLTIPGRSGLVRNTGRQTLINMKLLHLATRQMALDSVTTGETNIGWPGEIGGSFSNWTRALVAGGYLSTNDLCKLLSGPGKIVRTNALPTDMGKSAVLVYAVRSESPENAVLFSSANFTNTPEGGEALAADARPYGNKLFIVFRKNGEGGILRPKHVGDSNVIGSYAPLCR